MSIIVMKKFFLLLHHQQERYLSMVYTMLISFALLSNGSANSLAKSISSLILNLLGLIYVSFPVLI